MLALKEWSIVCKALESGKQSILLRKGGILEYKNGFEVSQKIFLFYPTLEHQAREYVQANYLQEFEFQKTNDVNIKKQQIQFVYWQEWKLYKNSTMIRYYQN